MRAIRVAMAAAVAATSVGVAEASVVRFDGAPQARPAKDRAGLAGHHRLAQREDPCTRASFSGCDVMRSPPTSPSAPAAGAEPSPKGDKGERERHLESVRPKGKGTREQDRERGNSKSGEKKPQR